MGTRGRKPSGIRKARHHVHLTEGRWERLTELYSPQGITPSSVIDQLVGFHLARVDEKVNLAPTQPMKPAEVESGVELDLDLSELTSHE